MATRDAKEKDLWVAFAVAALGSCKPDVDADDLDEVIDDRVAFASSVADGMLDALDARYTEKKGRQRRHAEEPDDDEED